MWLQSYGCIFDVAFPCTPLPRRPSIVKKKGQKTVIIKMLRDYLGQLRRVTYTVYIYSTQDTCLEICDLNRYIYSYVVYLLRGENPDCNGRVDDKSGLLFNISSLDFQYVHSFRSVIWRTITFFL
jgi:hypothetical protein